MRGGALAAPPFDDEVGVEGDDVGHSALVDQGRRPNAHAVSWVAVLISGWPRASPWTQCWPVPVSGPL
jgi:hypothetical protein